MSKVITFSRHFFKSHPNEGKPTGFVEKFWKSIGYSNLADGLEREYSNWSDNEFNPKHHTIRAGNRFKVGEKFSPRVWSGTPYRSKQIIISEDVEVKQIFSFELTKSDYILDGKKLSLRDLEVVAKNDGLSCDDFECWFNSKPFKGQVICWSDEIRY